MTRVPRCGSFRLTARIIIVVLVICSLVFNLAAVASAQVTGLNVDIVQVDSQAFPKVVTSLTVTDETGMPVTGLTAADFKALEDGAGVPDAGLTVESDDHLNLRLVLGIDISTPPATLLKIQTVAKAFVDNLGPGDQMAIVAFGDNATVVHDFTDKKNDLKLAFDQLVAGGNFTALNDGALAGVKLFEAAASGRKAVVLLVDSGDNANTVPVDRPVQKARELRVPVFILGCGPKAQSSALSLSDFAKQTRAQSFILNTVEEVDVTLQKLGVQLRKGYQLTFQSALKADNAEHPLSISAARQGKEGQGEGSFVAFPGTVTVALASPSNGQTVTGQVNLAPQVMAPAPVASVEYLLDGQSLANVTTSPYSFDLDSTTVAPGAHTLTVRATDTAGNQGQAEVSFTVVLPLTVTASASKDRVAFGEEVAIEAQVEAVTPVKAVDFLLDGKLLGSDSSAPYRVSFRNWSLTPSEHVVVVRAQDSSGQSAEASLNIAFVVVLPGWLRFILLALLLAVIVVATLALLIALLGIPRRRLRDSCRVEVSNLGNVRSRYELRADDPMGALKFKFTLNGTDLPPRAGAPAKPQTTTAAQPAAKTNGQKPAPSAGGTTAAGVGEAKDKAMTTGNAIVNWLNSLGEFLPGSLGARLRGVGSTVRRGQYTVARAERAADTASAAKSMVTPTSGSAGSPAQAAPAESATGGAPVPAAVEPQIQAAPEAPNGWVQSPIVEPGETLTIDLMISPLRPSRTQNYTFRVVSRPVDLKEAAEVMEQGTIAIKGLTGLQRFLIVLAVVVLLVLVVLFIRFLLISMGVFGL